MATLRNLLVRLLVLHRRLLDENMKVTVRRDRIFKTRLHPQSPRSVVNSLIPKPDDFAASPVVSARRMRLWWSAQRAC